MPHSTGTFGSADRVAGMHTGPASSGTMRPVAICLSNGPVLISPLNLSFFFARIGLRALHGSLQEARRLG
jgi:hypothetical protein